MKPFRIFLFGLSVFSILAVCSIVLPERIVFSNSFSIKFPSFHRILSNKKPEYKDISHILKLSDLVKDSVRVKKEKATENLTGFHQNHFSDSALHLNSDSLRSIIRSIEFPEGNDTLLNRFFTELRNLPLDKKLIRIIHYGDSQIEGDRITAYLRN